MASAKNTHRAKFSYVKRSDIERLIAAGQIDANDIVYTNDTHENIFIGSDLSIHPIQSKIYRFSDISTAESELNIATDTYEGQIVAILTNDTYVAYIVNKRGDAYYVSKLDEGNADVNYDALGNRPIYNLVGTLDKFVIVSELSDGVYKIRGQYKICLGDATVYSSANDNFFLAWQRFAKSLLLTSLITRLWIMPSLLNLAFQQRNGSQSKNMQPNLMWTQSSRR